MTMTAIKITPPTEPPTMANISTLAEINIFQHVIVFKMIFFNLPKHVPTCKSESEQSALVDKGSR
jgi:hypothetical protein